MTKVYSTKSNANRAAKKLEAGTFEIVPADGGFAIQMITVTAEPAVSAIIPHHYPAPAAAPKRVAKRTPAAPIRRKSVTDTPVAIVHQICSGLREANPNATRKEMLAACARVGIATNTARTQYQVWKNRH